MALGMGVIHAFDADHIASVATLASRDTKWRNGLIYAVRWSLGHGLTLVAITLALLFLQMELPGVLLEIAELLVGAVLIIAGARLVHSMRKQPFALETTGHAIRSQAHLDDVENSSSQNRFAKNNHAPTLVGTLHGVAGSATALALLTATMEPGIQSSFGGLVYILLFSIGVLAGMGSFGILLGQGQRQLQALHPKAFLVGQSFIAFTTISLGCFWIAARL